MKTNQELVRSAVSLIQASAQLALRAETLDVAEQKKIANQQTIYAAKLEVLAWALTDKE